MDYSNDTKAESPFAQWETFLREGTDRPLEGSDEPQPPPTAGRESRPQESSCTHDDMDEYPLTPIREGLLERFQKVMDTVDWSDTFGHPRTGASCKLVYRALFLAAYKRNTYSVCISHSQLANGSGRTSKTAGKAARLLAGKGLVRRYLPSDEELTKPTTYYMNTDLKEASLVYRDCTNYTTSPTGRTWKSRTGVTTAIRHVTTAITPHSPGDDTFRHAVSMWEVYNAIAYASAPLKAAEIAEATGRCLRTVYTQLAKLRDYGHVERNDDATYSPAAEGNLCDLADQRGTRGETEKARERRKFKSMLNASRARARDLGLDDYTFINRTLQWLQGVWDYNTREETVEQICDIPYPLEPPEGAYTTIRKEVMENGKELLF